MGYWWPREIFKNFFIKIIENKRAETLLPIAVNHVILGATIYTDRHPSCGKFSNYGFLHMRVNHSQ